MNQFFKGRTYSLGPLYKPYIQTNIISRNIMEIFQAAVKVCANSNSILRELSTYSTHSWLNDHPELTQCFHKQFLSGMLAGRVWESLSLVFGISINCIYKIPQYLQIKHFSVDKSNWLKPPFSPGCTNTKLESPQILPAEDSGQRSPGVSHVDVKPTESQVRVWSDFEDGWRRGSGKAVAIINTMIFLYMRPDSKAFGFPIQWTKKAWINHSLEKGLS